VPGALELDDAGGLEMLHPAIAARVGSPALLSVDQQRRTADPRPQPFDVRLCDIVWRPRADVVIELPAIGAVLVLVDAVHGQVPRLLGGEMLVLLVHPRVGVLDRRVATGKTSGEFALVLDPGGDAFLDRLAVALGRFFRRRAEAFDRDQPLDGIGEDAGVAQRDIAAERMADDRHRGEPELMDELREIVDVADHIVGAGARPCAVAVAAQIRRDHVPASTQALRHPIPVAAMVAPAVQQDERRRGAVAPVDVVEAQALREEDPRRGAGP
jgi:hypothetical protein